MASYSNRNNVWQVRIRVKGQPTLTKSFDTHKEAQRWATVTESQICRNEFVDTKSASLTSLGDLIQRYMLEVTPLMKSATTDLIKLAAIRRAAISQRKLTNLTPQIVAAHRDERLSKVANGTVIRELAYLSAIINHGRRDFYRTLVELPKLKSEVEVKIISVAKKNFGFNFSLVFYDLTTLYFESFETDNLRKIGFSKDNKASNPQIMMGLSQIPQPTPSKFR